MVEAGLEFVRQGDAYGKLFSHAPIFAKLFPHTSDYADLRRGAMNFHAAVKVSTLCAQLWNVQIISIFVFFFCIPIETDRSPSGIIRSEPHEKLFGHVFEGNLRSQGTRRRRFLIHM